MSGFSQTDILKHLTIGRLWLAWTEDPNDSRAIELHRDKFHFTEALRQAHASLAASPANVDQAGRIAELLAFEGINLTGDPEALGLANDDGGNRTQVALKAVTDKPTLAGTPQYFSPGQVTSIKTMAGDTLNDIRVYVLGPPRDGDSLKLMDRQGDLYDDGTKKSSPKFSLFSWASRQPGVASTTDDTAEDDGVDDSHNPLLDNPFGENPAVISSDNPKQRKQFDELKDAYFGSNTGNVTTTGKNAKPKPDNSWRNIDLDWLGASETMALQLNTFTNNTSLVLAIELTRQGKVLLFPGDAQLGNWLSWQSVQFGELDKSATPVAGRSVVTTDDLLARTVFYKVGHHGSHNATPKGAGLEKMTNPNLVAMMPVSHEMVAGRGWPIPFETLRKRLFEKTNNQCARADFSDPSALTDKANLAAFKTDPLFIEYNVSTKPG